MKRRGELVRTELPDAIRTLLPALTPRVGVDDRRAQGAMVADGKICQKPTDARPTINIDESQ
jgi:hypothetical protein